MVSPGKSVHVELGAELAAASALKIIDTVITMMSVNLRQERRRSLSAGVSTRRLVPG